MQDLNGEALAAHPKPKDIRPQHSRYVVPKLRPTTLDELREACRPHGDLAVQDARWSAIGLWLMWSPQEGLLTNAMKVAIASHALCRSDFRMHGYPNLSGIPYKSELPTLSTAAQEEARLVAAETMADWELAGCPYLDKAISQTDQHIAAYLRENPVSSAEATA